MGQQITESGAFLFGERVRDASLDRHCFPVGRLEGRAPRLDQLRFQNTTPPRMRGPFDQAAFLQVLQHHRHHLWGHHAGASQGRGRDPWVVGECGQRRVRRDGKFLRMTTTTDRAELRNLQ